MWVGKNLFGSGNPFIKEGKTGMLVHLTSGEIQLQELLNLQVSEKAGIRGRSGEDVIISTSSIILV
jgi:hypothetical protein